MLVQKPIYSITCSSWWARRVGAALKYFADNGLTMQYDELHKVLGEGNFVLTMSEGKFQ